MIKTIKEGKNEFKTVCSRCGCIYSYELDDIDELWNTTECPHCKHLNKHPDQDNTYSIEEFLKYFNEDGCECEKEEGAEE